MGWRFKARDGDQCRIGEAVVTVRRTRGGGLELDVVAPDHVRLRRQDAPPADIGRRGVSWPAPPDERVPNFRCVAVQFTEDDRAAFTAADTDPDDIPF